MAHVRLYFYARINDHWWLQCVCVCACVYICMCDSVCARVSVGWINTSLHMRLKFCQHLFGLVARYHLLGRRWELDELVIGKPWNDVKVSMENNLASIGSSVGDHIDTRASAMHGVMWACVDSHTTPWDIGMHTPSTRH